MELYWVPKLEAQDLNSMSFPIFQIARFSASDLSPRLIDIAWFDVTHVSFKSSLLWLLTVSRTLLGIQHHVGNRTMSKHISVKNQ